MLASRGNGPPVGLLDDFLAVVESGRVAEAYFWVGVFGLPGR
jgi:hypothetical protein